ncbi:MAG: diacylglycerol kinase family lipid kinase [Vicinamibacterales bacterium]|nr:diacylglycerol kinase family lipid kinase [Vicinamibacterales bacterium]
MTVSPDGSVVVIINPVSGPTRRGRAADRAAVAKQTFDRLKVPGDIRVSEHRGHAHELALDAVRGGARLVIAWGGDGTINEVGRALVHSSTSLGIVPGGSGNGLSRELNIPFDPSAALERALAGRDRVMDAGDIDGHLFFNIAGVGLDAHVAAQTATRVHHRGLLPYLTASTRDVLTFQPSPYSIEADTGSFDVTALVVVIANSRQYGFGARVAPQAASDDGWLDVIAIEDRGLLGNVRRLPSIFLGGFDRQAGVRAIKARHVRIRAQLPMPVHADGEPMRAGLDVHVRVHAAALRVRV